jgi:hypothetical protein
VREVWTRPVSTLSEGFFMLWNKSHRFAWSFAEGGSEGGAEGGWDLGRGVVKQR